MKITATVSLSHSFTNSCLLDLHVINNIYSPFTLTTALAIILSYPFSAIQEYSPESSALVVSISSSPFPSKLASSEFFKMLLSGRQFIKISKRFWYLTKNP